MAEVYVTLSEAAELESLQYKTLSKRIERNPDKFIISKERIDAGGKETTMVAISSLSPKAKKAWKERQKLKEIAELPAGQTDEEDKKAPWYIGMDVDWFIENKKKQWYRAMEKSNIVREYLDYDGDDRTEFTKTFARERLGVDARTLYRYADSYLEASAWADRIHKQDGGDYGFFRVFCLCRKPKEAGLFPSFTPEVKQAIRNIWFNREFAQNQGTREMLYEKLEAVRKANEWEKIPSYQSVVRYIAWLMQDEEMRNAWYLASRGEREYRNKAMVKGERSTKELQAMEILMGDVHTFDCWVAYTNPNGTVSAIKPHLVAWIDIKSRRVMGDIMCRDCNSDILKVSLLKVLYHDAGSVPKYIYIDNGKDYTAENMTGFSRKDRQRTGEQKTAGNRQKMEFDDSARGFYQSIGIQDYHRALPYYAWTKGEVERFFGNVCSRFTKWFSSYTGTLTGSKTFAKVDKDVKGMLERGELLTMEEFYEKWTEWLNTVYMVRKNSGLEANGEEWTTPKACFENADRYVKGVPPKKYATTLMMRSERCFVRNVGIKLKGSTYMSDELCDYINDYVDVKYDPYDMSTIYIFRNGKQKCQAYAQERLPFAVENGEEPPELLKEHFARQRQQIKKDRERLKEANVPFTTLNDKLVGFDAVGGLMIGGKPEKKENNVIQMPTDNTYRNGFRGGSEPEEEKEENTYMNKKAEEALKELRAL